jgi:hypothetical protein
MRRLLVLVAACHPVIHTVAQRSVWSSMRLALLDDVGRVSVTDRAGAFHEVVSAPNRLVAWSDPRTIVGTWTGGTIVVCAVDEDDECREISTVMDAWRLVPSPSGSRLLVEASGKGNPAWVVDATTGYRQSTPASEGAWLDNDRLVYVPYPSKELHVWNALNEHDEVLGTVDVPEIRSLTPSPDARYVAIVFRREEELPDTRAISHYGLRVLDVKTGVWSEPHESAKFQTHPDVAARGEPPLWAPGSARFLWVEEGELTLFDPSAPDLAPRHLGRFTDEALGWLDDGRVAYEVLKRSDASEVEKYGHGEVRMWGDVVVLDLASGEETVAVGGGTTPVGGVVFGRIP